MCEVLLSANVGHKPPELAPFSYYYRARGAFGMSKAVFGAEIMGHHPMTFSKYSIRRSPSSKLGMGLTTRPNMKSDHDTPVGQDNIQDMICSPGCPRWELYVL